MLGSLWIEMGPIRWPMGFSIVAIAVLTAWSALALFRQGAWADLRTKVFVDAILFWGGFAVVAGILGTLVGILAAAGAIEATGGASAGLVWGGIRVALLSTVLGFVVLAMAALAWFGLQFRWQLLRASEVGEGASA